MRQTRSIGGIVQMSAEEPTLTEESRKKIPQVQREAKQNTKNMAKELLAAAGITNDTIKANYNTLTGDIFGAINQSQLPSPNAMVQAQQTMQEQQVQKIPVVPPPVPLPAYSHQFTNPVPPVVPYQQPVPQGPTPEQQRIAQLEQQVRQLQATMPTEPSFMETGPRPLDRTMPERRQTTFRRQVGPAPEGRSGNKFGKILDTFNRRNFDGRKV